MDLWSQPQPAAEGHKWNFGGGEDAGDARLRRLPPDAASLPGELHFHTADKQSGFTTLSHRGNVGEKNKLVFSKRQSSRRLLGLFDAIKRKKSLHFRLGSFLTRTSAAEGFPVPEAGTLTLDTSRVPDYQHHYQDSEDIGVRAVVFGVRSCSQSSPVGEMS